MNVVDCREFRLVAGGTDPQMSLGDVWLNAFNTLNATLPQRPQDQPTDFVCVSGSVWIAGSICYTVDTRQLYLSCGVSTTPGLSGQTGFADSAEGVLEGWSLLVANRGVFGEHSLSSWQGTAGGIDISLPFGAPSASITYGVNAMDIYKADIAALGAESAVTVEAVSRFVNWASDLWTTYVAAPLSNATSAASSAVTSPVSNALWNSYWSSQPWNSVEYMDGGSTSSSAPPISSLAVGSIVSTSTGPINTPLTSVPLDEVFVYGTRESDADSGGQSSGSDGDQREVDFSDTIDLGLDSLFTQGALDQWYSTWSATNSLGDIAYPTQPPPPPPGFQRSPITGALVPAPSIPGYDGGAQGNWYPGMYYSAPDFNGNITSSYRMSDVGFDSYYSAGGNIYHSGLGGDWVVAGDIWWGDSPGDPGYADYICETVCAGFFDWAGYGQMLEAAAIEVAQQQVDDLLVRAQAGVELAEDEMAMLSSYLLSLASSAAVTSSFLADSARVVPAEPDPAPTTPPPAPPPVVTAPPPSDPPPSDPYYGGVGECTGVYTGWCP